MARAEFIGLMAMMFATIAFSVDAMLPALPQMAAQLSPDAPNQVQLVVTSFLLGMGMGTLITGPLSDSFGRKPVVLGGAAIYVLAALVGSIAQSLEVLLIARVVQGMGAAGPRVVTLAIIRDLFAGRGMARIVSFVMIVFTMVPALAPSMGAAILQISDWRGIFLAFMLFSVISAGWTALRLPETLPPAKRNPFRPAAIARAAREVITHPVVRLAIIAQTLLFGTLFAMISSVQQIYDVTFDRAAEFPLWFGAIAIFAGSSGFLNAALVMRLGMRFLVTAMLTAQLALTTAMILALAVGLPAGWAFGAFVAWQAAVFFQAGLTLGNMNALAMEPMGHIAGTAASVIGALATVGSVLLAVPVGLAFDGTPRPLAVGIWVMVALALGVMLRLRRVADRTAPMQNSI